MKALAAAFLALSLAACASVPVEPRVDYDTMQRATVKVVLKDGDDELTHGSGVLTAHGVVTAAHVVLGAHPKHRRVVLEFYDGEVVPATVERQRYDIGDRALEVDLALLAADVPAGYPVAGVNCARQPIGTTLYAVGAPGTLEWAVTEGKVISLRGPTPGHTPIAWLATDAVLWHGSSGGPMFTRGLRVVGIAQSIGKTRMGGGSTGHGFAMSGLRVCEFLGIANG